MKIHKKRKSILQCVAMCQRVYKFHFPYIENISHWAVIHLKRALVVHNFFSQNSSQDGADTLIKLVCE